MGRIPQKRATRGSQHWLQQLVEGQSAVLDDAIGLGPLHWLSPLAEDAYSEYQDRAFLNRLGVQLTHRPLTSFWPRGGPVWDGLALTSSGRCVLVEAKSHRSEMASTCKASERSRAMIAEAFREVQRGLGINDTGVWLDGFYQYANRLAHAYLLNELNAVPAELVFVYFVGDADMQGPASSHEWRSAISAMHEQLGITGRTPPYVRDVFVDVG